MALFINDIVDELDISSIEGYYEKGIKGYPPYHPRMMLKVLTYAHCTWVRSSRKVAKKIEEDVAYRFLTGGSMPKCRTIPESRAPPTWPASFTPRLLDHQFQPINKSDRNLPGMSDRVPSESVIQFNRNG